MYQCHITLLSNVSVKVHRVKLFSMRSHRKLAVLLTTDQQFTRAPLIFNSFLSNLTNLFSKSIVIIEVKSNHLAGLASLYLFSTSVTTVLFIYVSLLLLLTFDISFILASSNSKSNNSTSSHVVKKCKMIVLGNTYISLYMS